MTGNILEQRATALVAKWRATADGFASLGGDIAMAEAASMRNDANELEAALRLSAGEGWQPIETAPKDRTDILIAGGTYSVRDYPDLKFSGVGIAFWDRNHWHGNEANAHDEWCRHQPTHWQPLPAAPRHETGEGS